MGCEAPRVGHCDADFPLSQIRQSQAGAPAVTGSRRTTICPHGWWLCGLFSLRAWRAVWKAAHPSVCFPGSACRSPSACACQNSSLRRWEPPKGALFFPQLSGLTAHPCQRSECCRSRAPQTPRYSHPCGRPAPHSCRWTPADSPYRAAPAPRQGFHKRQYPHSP